MRTSYKKKVTVFSAMPFSVMDILPGFYMCNMPALNKYLDKGLPLLHAPACYSRINGRINTGCVVLMTLTHIQLGFSIRTKEEDKEQDQVHGMLLSQILSSWHEC
jgi:hypothetical protein